MADWTTPLKVKNLTGIDITEDDIPPAISVLEVITGWDLSKPEEWDGRDLRMMSLAVTYQCAYMVKNTSLITDMEYTSRSVADVSVTPQTSQGGTTLTSLAPLARVALRKMSRTKRARTQTVGRLENMVGIDALLERNDPSSGWVSTR